MSTVSLVESTPLSEAAASSNMIGTKFHARLLATDIWGSSGFYSREVVERDGPTAWPSGTQVFLDHPGATESFDRPERSVRDLAGRIASTPVCENDGLYADIEFYPHVASVVESMADDIGLSIRATAEVERGEVAGRTGPVITRLVEGISVDVVTNAGAGGKLVSLLESALTAAESSFTPAASMVRLQESRNVGQWIESRMHLDFTQQADDMFGDGRLSREERIAMSGAVGAALDAFTTSLEASAPQLYTRDLWEDPEVIASAIEAAFTKADAGVANTVKCKTCGHMASAHADVKGAANSGACAMNGCDCKAMAAPAAESADPTNVPVNPAGHTKQSLEDHMAQIQVDEAEYARVTADAGRVQTLESERDAAASERDAARTELASSRARDTARPIAAELVGASESLPPMVAARVIEAAVTGVTLGTDGSFDEAAFRTTVEAARTAAETEVAQIAESLGAGKVTGFGHTSTTQGEVSEADLDTILADAFGRTVKEA